MSDLAGIYWFSNTDIFRDANSHTSLLRNLYEELRRSDEEAIVDFRKTYSNTYPPSWMTFEISLFGTLSMIYKLLKAGRARRLVANYYGLADTVMASWLHAIVYIRNICAHHGRLWNKRLGINAIVPHRTNYPFVSIPHDTKKVYYILSIILYFQQTINPNNTFANRLTALLGKYPLADIHAMGFPTDWQEEPLWRQF